MFHSFYKQCTQCVGRSKLYFSCTFFPLVLTFTGGRKSWFYCPVREMEKCWPCTKSKVGKLNTCVEAAHSFERLFEVVHVFSTIKFPNSSPLPLFLIFTSPRMLNTGFSLKYLVWFIPREAHSQRRVYSRGDWYMWNIWWYISFCFWPSCLQPWEKLSGSGCDWEEGRGFCCLLRIWLGNKKSCSLRALEWVCQHITFTNTYYYMHVLSHPIKCSSHQESEPLWVLLRMW